MALQDLIQSSSLSQSQKSFWENKIKNASDFEKEAYSALFKSYSDDVLWVTDSLIAVERALADEDTEKYDKIRKEIEKKLNEILGGL